MCVLCVCVYIYCVYTHSYICAYTDTCICVWYMFFEVTWARHFKGINTWFLNFLLLNKQRMCMEESWAPNEHFLRPSVWEQGEELWCHRLLLRPVSWPWGFSFIRGSRRWYWLLSSVAFWMVLGVETNSLPQPSLPKLSGQETTHFAVMCGSGCWHLSWIFVKQKIG